MVLGLARGAVGCKYNLQLAQNRILVLAPGVEMLEVKTSQSSS